MSELEIVEQEHSKATVQGAQRLWLIFYRGEQVLRLRALCSEEGFSADTAVAEDASRVLTQPYWGQLYDFRDWFLDYAVEDRGEPPVNRGAAVHSTDTHGLTSLVAETKAAA